MSASNWRGITVGVAAFSLGTIATGSGTLRAAWEPLARVIVEQLAEVCFAQPAVNSPADLDAEDLGHR